MDGDPARRPAAGQPVELRIHGVGGSTPEALLGERHPDDVVQLDQGHRTGVWARRRDPSVRGYVWGPLTSGAKLQPLWVLLLPFTLVNVAGWMHPPMTGDAGRRRQIRDIRALVTLLGFGLTATWTVWLAVVVGDLVVYQWAGTHRPLPATAAWWVVAVGLVLAVAGLLWRWWPLGLAGGLAVVAAAAGHALHNATARAVGGVVLAELLMAAVAYVAGISRRDYESHVLAGVAPAAPRRAATDEDLRTTRFFAHPSEGLWLLGAHAALVALVTVALAAWAWARAHDGRASLGFGGAVIALVVIQLALLAVLALRSLGEWDQFNRRWRVAGPAVAAGLGLLFTAGVFTGLTLWVSHRVTGPPLGAERALADIYVEDAALVLAIVVLGLLPYFLSGGPGPAPAGASEEERTWRGTRYRRERLARAFRHIDLVATPAVGFFVVAGLIATVTRTDLNGTILPWHWSIDPDGGLGITRSVAVWVLPFLVPFLGMLVRLGARSAGARRNIGNLWDVLGLWPRRFHPFAVRPYAERAVPELQDQVRAVVTGERRPLVVSAHSQGSVLAFFALIGLAGDDDVRPVALVTYGSPLSRLHARFFPAYVSPDDRRWLLDRLGSWRSFFHPTDHIGQRVFDDVFAHKVADVRGLPSVDTELADPAEDGAGTEPVADPGLHLEPDRTPWSDIAGHNEYLRERRLKDWVEQVKRDLAGGGPSPPPPAG